MHIMCEYFQCSKAETKENLSFISKEEVNQISKEYPGWLDKILKLASDRNDAEHDSGKLVTQEQAFEHFESVEKLLIVMQSQRE